MNGINTLLLPDPNVIMDEELYAMQLLDALLSFKSSSQKEKLATVL
jgi:hypothetical protein